MIDLWSIGAMASGADNDGGDAAASEITLLAVLEGVADATTLTIDNFSFA